MDSAVPPSFDQHCRRRWPLPKVAFRSFAIGAVEGRKGLCPITGHAVGSVRFGVLRGFCRSRATRRRLLVVAPLAGGYPLVLRDLVVALLRELDEVVVTDWPDSRYVPKSVGAFGLSDNILHVEAMIRKLGPGLHVLGVCQGVVPALAATALLAAAGSEAAPLSLTLVGGPVDPMASPSRLVRLLRARPLAWFEENMIEEVDDAYPGRGRRIYSRSHQLETFSAYASPVSPSSSPVESFYRRPIVQPSREITLLDDLPILRLLQATRVEAIGRAG